MKYLPLFANFSEPLALTWSRQTTAVTGPVQEKLVEFIVHWAAFCQACMVAWG